MKIDAAILWEKASPLSVESAELAHPGEGEVLVEMKAAGVCHSDLHPARGDWPVRTPLVLGHEGSGIVREIGKGVTELRPGDHVVLCWAPACGRCQACFQGRAVLCDRLEKTTYRNRLPSGETRLRARDQDLFHFDSTACFADYTVVAAEGAVRVPDDIPFDALAMLGCSVVTGIGAVRHAAGITRPSKVCVIGAGGVGLNVIQGAVLAGCAPVIAVDLNSKPLSFAKVFGATDQILTSELSRDETVKAIKDLAGGSGADYVFDTVGSAATIDLALGAARKGGTIVVTGLSALNTIASVPLFRFVMSEHRLIGSVYGSGNPAADIVELANLYRSGGLRLKELVDRSYRLEEINEALRALGAGTGGRGVIRWE